MMLVLNGLKGSANEKFKDRLDNHALASGPMVSMEESNFISGQFVSNGQFCSLIESRLAANSLSMR